MGLATIKCLVKANGKRSHGRVEIRFRIPRFIFSPPNFERDHCLIPS